jgi:hypothetical protein
VICACRYPGCDTIIVVCDGASETNRCLAHKGLVGEGETDEARIDRVCTLFGWKRRVQK